MVLPTDTYRQSGPNFDSAGQWTDPLDFLTYLIATINADSSSKWVVSTSTAAYIELKPTVGAVNLNDRILLFVGTPAAAAIDPNSSTGLGMYLCMAPNAGTTGPDTDPTVGDPYTVASSLLIKMQSNLNFYQEMWIIESENMWCCYPVKTASTNAIQPFCAGRGFVNLDDELEPIIAVTAFDVSATMLESVSAAGPDMFFTAQPIPSTSGHARTLRFNGTAWENIRRFNIIDKDIGRSPDTLTFYYKQIWFSNSSGMAGYLHQIKSGFPSAPGTVKANGLGKFSYPISSDKDLVTNSTLYFMDV